MIHRRGSRGLLDKSYTVPLAPCSHLLGSRVVRSIRLDLHQRPLQARGTFMYLAYRRDGDSRAAEPSTAIPSSPPGVQGVVAERCQPLEELNSLSHAYYLWLSDIRGVVSRPVARSLAIVSVWKTGVRVYQNCWLYTLDRRRRERAIPLCISKSAIMWLLARTIVPTSCLGTSCELFAKHLRRGLRL